MRTDASMGPRSVERGNIRDRERLHLSRPASMGPRSVERGNPWSRREQLPRPPASMGPRSVERGNAAVTGTNPPEDASFNGATLGRAWKPSCRLVPTRVQFSGFNGATLGRAWKLPVGKSRFSRQQLQWGHAR